MDFLISETCKEKLKPEKCQQHTGKKLFCCEMCNKEIISNLKLQKDILTNTGGKTFICEVCGNAFSQKIDLVMHMVTHNGPSVKNITEETKGDNLVENRLIPVKNELNESFLCDVCCQDVTQESGLATHMCTPVLNKPSMSNNMRTKLTARDCYQNLSATLKKEVHACDLCEYFSLNKAKLLLHMRKHSPETGAIKFPKNDPLADNITGSCNICKREFTSKSSLFRHIRTHTGEKPFTCGVCQKEFAQRGTLRRHLQIHTGHKPFRCNVCAREFTQSCTLIRHIRTHTGEKPYKCNVCDKRFSQNGALLQHIRLHTGEKPHKCRICYKNFSTRSHLLSHVMTHLGEEAHGEDDNN